MGEIYGKYMLSAITRAVSAEFDGEAKVYNETPMQNAELPYLFVGQIQMTQTPNTFRRHDRNYFYDVRYHPNDKQGSSNAAIADAQERLFSCLRMIETPDRPARASSIRAEASDGVLHVFADYPVRVELAVEKQPDMRELTIYEAIKEE